MSTSHGNQSGLDFRQVLKAAFYDDKYQLKTINCSQLIPDEYDKIELTYTGEDVTTVVYKKNNVTIATLALAYSSGKLSSVTRT